ncbi:class I SAM-dependent RNA methyltransferase [Profundibacter sp.]
MTVTILRLGHQGDGIAEGPVFAPRTLPGEVIEGEVSAGRIAAPKIITPSPVRVAAPCRHYKSCGGCSLQHASDEFVADWKQNVVRTALAAQHIEADLRATQTSPPRSRRRAVLTGRRTKKDALVGFHARGTNTITDISDCHLLHPDLLASLPALRALTVVGTSRKGELRFTITRSVAGVDVAVAGAKPLDGQLLMTLASMAGEHGLARLTWDGEPVVDIASPYQMFGQTRVVPPAGAFLQATAEGENVLVSAVLEIVSGSKHVLDLFAGCGTFTLPIAVNAEVHAVEDDTAMLKALDQGWRQATGLKRVTCETRDLFRRPMLPDEISRFDAVVIDPPRAGATQQMSELAKAKPMRIAAVSCNPVSFAQDAKLLIDAGYRLGRIDVVDQFRWSTHVELVAAFTLK